LTGDLISLVLEKIENIETSDILNHPFFWDHWKILNFISVTADYVLEGAPIPSVVLVYTNTSVTLLSQIASYPKTKWITSRLFLITEVASSKPGNLSMKMM
jgi:hypothetical protein